MINVDLRHLEQRLVKRFERLGVEKVRSRARQLVAEMRESAKQWLSQSRQMLGVTAMPWIKTDGPYPRSYKHMPHDTYGYGTNKKHPDNYLVDSVFYSIRIRDNARSSTITVNRGFRDDFTIDSINSLVLQGRGGAYGGMTARFTLSYDGPEAAMSIYGVPLSGDYDAFIAQNGLLRMQSETNGASSVISVANTSITLDQQNGLIYVDSLTQGASMTGRMVMVRNVANNVWEEIAASSIISGGGGLTAITANNGLSVSTSSNTQLGGSALVQNSSITTSAFNLSIASSNASYTFESTNSSTGHALSGSNTSTGAGVSAYSAGGFGVLSSSAASYAGNFQTETATTNAIINTLLIDARTSGTPATNLGTGILFQGETSTTAGTTIGQIAYRWSTVTHASRTSEFVVSAVNAASTREMMVMNGVGYTTFTGQYYSAMYTLTDAATIALDWNNGNCQMVTLAGSRTFTFANPKAGARYMIELIQGGSGSYTITWPTIKWQGGAAPTLTTTVGKTDLIFLTWDGTSYFGSSSLNF